MISFKPLLRTSRKFGLVFMHDRGVALEVRSCTGNRLCWHEFISFANIESDHTAPCSDIPKVSGWVLIIPAYQCITKYAVLPSADPVEIEKMIEFELPNIVSYNTQPWVWDFSIIGQQVNGASKTLIVLSPLSIIDRHIKTLSSLGIKPNVVTPSAMFYALLLSKKETLLKSSPVGCFCLEDDYMDFFVIESKQVTFFRGIQLKKEFHENIRFMEAEIRRSISMVKDNGTAGYPTRFFVINRNNPPTNSVKIVEKVLGSSVEEVEFAALYNEHPITDSSTTFGQDDYLSLVSGEAHINLLPAHLKGKYRRSKKRRQMVLHALKVCFVLLLAFLCLKASIWRKSRLLEQYNQRLSVISPLAEKLQFLQQQLFIIENELQGHVSTLDIVSELYRVLPKDITVHYFSIERNKKVVIRARAKLLSRAFDCIGPLEQSDYFGNVRQSYANQRQIENSVLIDFEIIADLQKARHSGDRK